MLRKFEKEVKKEVGAIKHGLGVIRADEEKVVFTLGNFKVRKKLFFSILLSIIVFTIGIGKVESLIGEGFHTSPLVVLLTFAFCSIFLLIAVIRKSPRHHLKQLGKVFVALTMLCSALVFLGEFNFADVLFISMITTTVSLLIYDTF